MLCVYVPVHFSISAQKKYHKLREAVQQVLCSTTRRKRPSTCSAAPTNSWLPGCLETIFAEPLAMCSAAPM